MSTKIQLRRGTAAQWTATNPTLASGEQGYETDTGRVKVGDGVTAWSSLRYLLSSLAPYVGFIADRTRSAFAFSAANKQWGGRHGVYARDDITPATQMRLLDAGFYTGGAGEVTSDVTMSYAIEYPAGTIIPVTYAGAASALCAAGALLYSDPIAVTIPRGAKFWIRYYKTSVAGMIYVGGANIPFSDHDNGDTFEFGANGITNKTLAGNVANTDVNSGFSSPPVAIVGNTSRRSFALLGDSRVTGVLDHWGDAARRRGTLERTIGRFFASTTLSQAAETAAIFNGAAGSIRRSIALAHASDVITAYGINDVGSGATTARLAAMYAAFATKRVWACTLSPYTTSTDAWATLANQTVTAGEAERVTVNKFVRGQPAGVYGVLDIADVTETARSGKWNVAYTNDPSQATAFEGLHETSLACQAIAASAQISPALLGYSHT